MEKEVSTHTMDGEKGISHVWQIIVGVVVFLAAAVISVFEIISQSRKYKKASIPIEVSKK